MAGSVPPCSVRSILSALNVRAPGQVGGAEAQGARVVIDGRADGRLLAGGDPLGLFRRAGPAGVVAGHHACLSQVFMAEVVRRLEASGIG